MKKIRIFKTYISSYGNLNRIDLVIRKSVACNYEIKMSSQYTVTLHRTQYNPLHCVCEPAYLYVLECA